MHDIGRVALKLCTRLIKEGMAQRTILEQDGTVFVDIQFDDLVKVGFLRSPMCGTQTKHDLLHFVKNKVASVATIYDRLGLKFTDEISAGIDGFLGRQMVERAKSVKQSKTAHKLEAFGVHGVHVDRVFADYTELYLKKSTGAAAIPASSSRAEL